jgi:tRNA-2-methylthio-N6-dimethylallyladenosine synthase
MQSKEKTGGLPQAIGTGKTAFVRTFGCQQNFADSEKIRGQLALLGYGRAQDVNSADVIVFNTCAVRENAEDRVFGNVGALKKLKAGAHPPVIVVCGCMTQQAHQAEFIRKRFGFVDIVLGTNAVADLPKVLTAFLTTRRKTVSLADFSDEAHYPITENHDTPAQADCRDSKVLAGITVMYGCNNFCTYCIVPYVRGRETSRRPDEILAEARGLIAGGYKSLLLLGQNVNSYGKGSGFDTDFPGLLKQIDALDGDFRIEFMTSHPKDCSDELLSVMANSGRITRRLHLPAQSGSDRVLQAMNRKYTREKYLERVKTARKLMPDVAVTTDIIVGFPGETDEDFNDTLSLVKEAGFEGAYTFIYSKRPGTRAAEFPDETTNEEKHERFVRLTALLEEIGAEYYARQVGRVCRVLFDKPNSGHNRQGITVELEDNNMVNDRTGQFQDVLITKARRAVLVGRLF